MVSLLTWDHFLLVLGISKLNYAHIYAGICTPTLTHKQICGHTSHEDKPTIMCACACTQPLIQSHTQTQAHKHTRTHTQFNHGFFY